MSDWKSKLLCLPTNSDLQQLGLFAFLKSSSFTMKHERTIINYFWVSSLVLMKFLRNLGNHIWGCFMSVDSRRNFESHSITVKWLRLEIQLRSLDKPIWRPIRKSNWIVEITHFSRQQCSDPNRTTFWSVARNLNSKKRRLRFFDWNQQEFRAQRTGAR